MNDRKKYCLMKDVITQEGGCIPHRLYYYQSPCAPFVRRSFYAPVFRLSPYISNEYPVEVIVSSSKINFTVKLPHAVVRSFVNDIYKFGQIYNTNENAVTFKIISPQFTTSYVSSYNALFDLLNKASMYKTSKPLFSYDGKNMELYMLLEKLKQLLSLKQAGYY